MVRRQPIGGQETTHRVAEELLKLKYELLERQKSTNFGTKKDHTRGRISFYKSRRHEIRNAVSEGIEITGAGTSIDRFNLAATVGAHIGSALTASQPRAATSAARMPTLPHLGATVSERLACSPPTKANRVLSLAGSLPGFWHVGIVPDDAAGPRDLPFSPPFHSGSQYLAVKSRPNLFTKSLTSSLRDEQGTRRRWLKSMGNYSCGLFNLSWPRRAVPGRGEVGAR
ncbi:hypothetical protein PR048_027636 [Dryococelus australis]|uniref:Uncharacterized protein n=1 Tax=Dryococelus australis TaxID=614101 RepID=A0ABQ9GH16_9NEOP|nr:hypothetical protein PR048_027636 [Dryococelus australis]